MKILFIISSLQIGGEQRVVNILSDELIKKEHEVDILVLNRGEIGYKFNEKINIRYVEVNEFSKMYKNLNKVKKIRRLLATNCYNQIIAFAMIPSILSCIAKIGIKTTTKIIISERNSPHIYPLGWRIIRRVTFNRADAAVFQTMDAQNYYIKWLKKPSKIIYNPIQVNNLPNRYKGKRDKEIITAGRLVEAKNHTLLISAFKKVNLEYPEFILKIYGEGPNRKELEELIEKLGIANKVKLMGKSNKIFDEIYKSTLFILTSNHEGFPNALAEAMCLGLAVISTDCPVGGPKTMIENNKNGIIVPLNNEEELVKAIKQVLKDEMEIERLGREAYRLREKVEATYIIEEWIELIESIENR